MNWRNCFDFSSSFRIFSSNIKFFFLEISSPGKWKGTNDNDVNDGLFWERADLNSFLLYNIE